MAGKQIRGITIEIDGDTSKLGKALQDVEKKSRSTNQSLKEIERNLKFNPGNTELVAQQQRKLQDAISETKEKLVILKNADEQAKKQLANGEISQDQYDALQREIIATEKYLESYEKRLGTSQNEQAKFDKATGSIATVLEKSGKSIDDFSDILGEDLVNAYKKGEGSSADMEKALDKLGQELLGTGGNAEKLEERLNKLEDGVSFDDIVKEAKKSGDEFGVLGDKAEDSKKEIDKINDVSVNVVGLNSLIELFEGFKDTVLGAISSIQDAWGELDEGLDTIVTKTGLVGEASEEMSEIFDRVYNDMPATASDVGNAIGELNTQFGLQGDALDEATRAMLKYSEINGADVTQSTIGAKQAMAQFGLESENLSSVLDVVTKTAQNTGASTDSLLSAVADSAPILQGMNLSFEESVALIGEFEQNGIQGSKALGYLTRAQSTAAKDGKSLNDVLDDFTKFSKSSASETEKLNKASSLFGTKGGALLLKMAKDGALNFKELNEKVKDSKDAVTTTYEGILDPVDKWVVVQNNAKSAMAEFSNVAQEMLAPILDTIVKAIQSVTTWFKGLGDGTKKVVVAVGGLVTGLTLVAGVLASVKLAFGMLQPILAGLLPSFSGLTGGAKGLSLAIGGITAPIGIVIGAIGGLIAVFVTLWKTNEEFRNNITTLWIQLKETIGELITGITERLGGLKEMFSAVIEFIKPIWLAFCNFLAPVFEGAFGIILSIFNAIKDTMLGILDIFIGIFTGNWKKAWDGVKLVFSGIWEGIKGILDNVLNTIKQIVSSAVEGIRNTVTNVFNGLKNTVSNIWNGIKAVIFGVWNSIRNGVYTAVNAVRTTVSSVFDGIRNTTVTIWNGIKSAIVNPISAAKNVIGRIINGIKGLFNFEFKWPHIPLPHFTISGSLNPINWLKNGLPSIGVSWYAKGGIFDKPSVIGVGEAGSEAVIPTNKLDAFLADGVERVLKNIKNTDGGNGKNIVINVQEMNVREDNDIRRIAEEVIRQMSIQEQRRLNLGGLA